VEKSPHVIVFKPSFAQLFGQLMSAVVQFWLHNPNALEANGTVLVSFHKILLYGKRGRKQSINIEKQTFYILQA